MNIRRALALLALGVVGLLLALAGGTLAGGAASAETVTSTGPGPQACDPNLPAPKSDKKVTLCHATGSESNPFIINEVSESGAASHLLTEQHHGDCGFYGSQTDYVLGGAPQGNPLCIQL